MFCHCFHRKENKIIDNVLAGFGDILCHGKIHIRKIKMSVVPSECSSPAYSSSKEVERTAETASSEAETEERDSGIRNILKTFEQF